MSTAGRSRKGVPRSMSSRAVNRPVTARWPRVATVRKSTRPASRLRPPDLPGSDDVITLASADDVYAVLPDRYQLRCEVPAGRPPRFAAAGTRAVAFASPVLTDWVMAFGEPGEAAALLVSVIAAMPVPPRGFTLPRDAHRLLPPDPAIRWLDHW